MIIRETIRHGDYHNVREQTIANPEYSYGNPMTFAGLCELLAASPYNSGKTLEQQANNEYVAKLFVDLSTTGKGSYGWADYQVIAP